MSAALREAGSKRVVMLSCDGFDRGGIGRWAAYVFRAWRDIPEAPVLSMIDTRAPSGRIFPSILAFAGAMAKLVALCALRRVDLIHVNIAARGSTARKFVAISVARLFGIPYVLHLHAGDYIPFYRGLPRPARRAVRGMFEHAAKVIVLGKVWEDSLAAELGIPRERMVVMFNAVAPPATPRPPRPAGPCHIVMLARLEPQKGADELIAALGGDALRPLAWRATLAGTGGEHYRALAASRGVADRIAFPGWIGGDAVAALLAEADILALPSHFECMPVSVLEAMAHGVAVVATPVGAVPEILMDGESGLLVPVGDAPALAAALRRLILDPGLRDALGASGHAVFERALDVRQSALRLAGLYREILHCSIH